MFKSFTLLMMISGLLAGCATGPQKIAIQASLDRSQAQTLLSEGTNTIRGSALIRQRAGGVVSCAGRDVVLIPETAYASERMQALYGNTQRGYNPAFGGRRVNLENGDSADYAKLTKRTQCDAQGFFKFEKIANGNFYVATVINWQVSDYFQEGGSLMQRVSVSNGEVKEIVLAP